MSINGVSASTLNGDRAASSDGVDDFGTADGPQDLPENETFGVAMVVSGTDKTDNSNFIGAIDGSAEFQVIDIDFFDSSNGELFIGLTDNAGNKLQSESTDNVMDGARHLICVNKVADTGIGPVEIYVDDMNVDIATVVNDDGFDHTNYSMGSDMAFFSRSSNGTIVNQKALNMPFIEFNEEPYSPLERQALKRRVDAIPSVP
jgi:hypothetical protein